MEFQAKTVVGLRTRVNDSLRLMIAEVRLSLRHCSPGSRPWMFYNAILKELIRLRGKSMAFRMQLYSLLLSFKQAFRRQLTAVRCTSLSCR